MSPSLPMSSPDLIHTRHSLKRDYVGGLLFKPGPTSMCQIHGDGPHHEKASGRITHSLAGFLECHPSELMLPMKVACEVTHRGMATPWP